jgi:hypothetical protein
MKTREGKIGLAIHGGTGMIARNKSRVFRLFLGAE